MLTANITWNNRQTQISDQKSVQLKRKVCIISSVYGVKYDVTKFQVKWVAKLVLNRNYDSLSANNETLNPNVRRSKSSFGRKSSLRVLTTCLCNYPSQRDANISSSSRIIKWSLLEGPDSFFSRAIVCIVRNQRNYDALSKYLMSDSTKDSQQTMLRFVVFVHGQLPNSPTRVVFVVDKEKSKVPCFISHLSQLYPGHETVGLKRISGSQKILLHLTWKTLMF